jgi:hypothetical protein
MGDPRTEYRVELRTALAFPVVHSGCFPLKTVFPRSRRSSRRLESRCLAERGRRSTTTFGANLGPSRRGLCRFRQLGRGRCSSRDGKTYVATRGRRRFLVARLNADGSLDTGVRRPTDLPSAELSRHRQRRTRWRFRLGRIGSSSSVTVNIAAPSHRRGGTSRGPVHTRPACSTRRSGAAGVARRHSNFSPASRQASDVVVTSRGCDRRRGAGDHLVEHNTSTYASRRPLTRPTACSTRSFNRHRAKVVVDFQTRPPRPATRVCWSLSSRKNPGSSGQTTTGLVTDAAVVRLSTPTARPTCVVRGPGGNGH